MISYPSDWRSVGIEIKNCEIKGAIVQALSDVNCTDLALSGGIDSSLMLHYLVEMHGASRVRAFTIALNESHPDCIYAKVVANALGVRHVVFIPDRKIETGDTIVKVFYGHLKSVGIKRIIACDGIDELMGGYYRHQESPCEEIYFIIMRELVAGHLIPLDENSADIQVVLPYISNQLVSLLSQIPIADKFDSESRKKIIVELATEAGVPAEIISRRKYGFCDAMIIKQNTRRVGRNYAAC